MPPSPSTRRSWKRGVPANTGLVASAGAGDEAFATSRSRHGRARLDIACEPVSARPAVGRAGKTGGFAYEARAISAAGVAGGVEELLADRALAGAAQLEDAVAQQAQVAGGGADEPQA